MKIRLAIALIAPAIAIMPALAQTTSIPEGIRSSETALGDTQKAVIVDFFTTCASKMVEAAKDPKAMTQLRASMLSQFGRDAGAGFRAAAAEACAKNFAPVVFADSSDNAVKTNGAIVTAAIASPAAADLYAAMTANAASPAIRYHGWKGFGGIAKTLLDADSTQLPVMLNALKAAGASETSVLVDGAMAKACDVEIATNFPRGQAEAYRTTLLPVFTQVFARNMQAVRDGDPVACDALMQATTMLGDVYAGAPDAQRVAVMKLVAQVMANAARAYDEQVKASGGKTPHFTVSLLITEGERALNALRNENSLAITRLVAQMIKQPSEQGFAEVQDRVNELIGGNGVQGELEAQGVPAPTVLQATRASAEQ